MKNLQSLQLYLLEKVLGRRGAARASQGGQATHPEDQHEEENKEKMRENMETDEALTKCSYLAHTGVGS